MDSYPHAHLITSPHRRIVASSHRRIVTPSLDVDACLRGLLEHWLRLCVDD
jgi:hypothetical protein